MHAIVAGRSNLDETFLQIARGSANSFRTTGRPLVEEVVGLLPVTLREQVVQRSQWTGRMAAGLANRESRAHRMLKPVTIKSLAIGAVQFLVGELRASI